MEIYKDKFGQKIIERFYSLPSEEWNVFYVERCGDCWFGEWSNGTRKKMPRIVLAQCAPLNEGEIKTAQFITKKLEEKADSSA